MIWKQYTAEMIIGLLREADLKLSQGRKVGQVGRDMGITEQTLDREMLGELAEGD